MKSIRYAVKKRKREEGGKGGWLKEGETGRFWIKKVANIPLGGGGEDGDGH